MRTVAEIETRKSKKEAKLRLNQSKLEWTLTGENWDMFAFVRNKTYSYSLENVYLNITPGHKNMFGSNPALLRITTLKPRKDVVIIKFPYEQQQELLNFFDKYKNTKKENEKKIKYQKIVDRAQEREKARDYATAIEIWESLGKIEEAARARKAQAEMGSVKVAQSVVQGDQITKTKIKDSVLNRSNVGAGGDDKFAKLKELKEMFDSGFISKEEMENMKKEILGK